MRLRAFSDIMLILDPSLANGWSNYNLDGEMGCNGMLGPSSTHFDVELGTFFYCILG